MLKRFVTPVRAFWIVLGIVILLAMLTGDTLRRPVYMNVVYAAALTVGWYYATVAVCIPVVLLRRRNRRKFWQRVNENIARHEAMRQARRSSPARETKPGERQEGRA